VSRINQIEQLIYEYLTVAAIITDNPNEFSRQGVDSHLILSPSRVIKSIPHLDIQVFDVIILTLKEALGKSTLETRKNTLLTMRSNSLVGYRWTKRVLLTVTSPIGFAVGDAVHDADSSGTGTIVRISGSTIYLNNCTGAWILGDSFTNDVATTTLTSAETEETYPIALDVQVSMSGTNGYQMTIEGRWEL